MPVGRLPYSVNEIYYLKNSGYYQNTRQVYNSMHQVYPEVAMTERILPSVVLTEDSNADYSIGSQRWKELIGIVYL